MLPGAYRRRRTEWRRSVLAGSGRSVIPADRASQVSGSAVQPPPNGDLRAMPDVVAKAESRDRTSAGSAIMALLLAAAGAPSAEPGEQEYPGHQHDPADPEHPEEGGVAAGEGVD